MSQKRPAGEPPELHGYEHVRLLGSGGFADVFLYSQHLPRRNVAVKVMTEEAAEGQSREQFTAEANLMAQLSSHSSIVSIYHAGTSPDGRPFLVMQYCPLPNLAERTRRRPLGVAESVGIGVRLSGALETAHRAGIVHRDIKPANVLTTEYGRPALTDFGIAGLLSNTLTETAGLSIPWAPPEAIDGQVTGVEGDVYSLGATIFTLLVGRSPFTRPGGPNTRLDYTTRIRRDPVPRIEREDLPDSLQRVLDKAMAKQPAQRYRSAADLGRALQIVEQEMRLPMTEIEMPDTSWLAPDPQDRRKAPRAALENREGSRRADDASGASADSSAGTSSGSSRPSTGSRRAAGAASAPESTSGDRGASAPPGPGTGAGGTVSGGSEGRPEAGTPQQGAARPPAEPTRVNSIRAVPPQAPPARSTDARPPAAASADNAGAAAWAGHRTGLQAGMQGADQGGHPGGAFPGAGSPASAGVGAPMSPGAGSPASAGVGGPMHPPGHGQGTQPGPAGSRRAGSGVVITAVACVMAVVVALIWAFGTLTGDDTSSGDGEVTADASGPTTIDVPDLVPTPVDLVGTRAGSTVEFTWAAPDELDGQDVTYVWQRTDGSFPLASAEEPVASVEEPGEVCIEVKIRLTNGRTSNEPATTCVDEEA
ncbi:protein kinase domain-containing protein [Georgenia sp. Z1491]|uniref:serine/threonine-protein kinase n=1 Tax=Georgenia sp. Z1491 TaxID=3416707 RepID=UPI003CE8AB49